MAGHIEVHTLAQRAGRAVNNSFCETKRHDQHGHVDLSQAYEELRVFQATRNEQHVSPSRV